MSISDVNPMFRGFDEGHFHMVQTLSYVMNNQNQCNALQASTFHPPHWDKDPAGGPAQAVSQAFENLNCSFQTFMTLKVHSMSDSGPVQVSQTADLTTFVH